MSIKKQSALKIKQPQAYWYLGDALNQQGKRQQAIAVWREAISRNPKDTVALSKVRLALQEQVTDIG
ncbi:MAG: tetratricopeptide repeat protein [Potamolinea sp.]